MNEIIYTLPEIIIGGNCNSLTYAFNNNIPLICAYKKEIFVPNEEEGYRKKFEKLYFVLSLAGNILVPYEKGLKVVIDREKKQLNITVKNIYLIQINYKKLIIFNDYNVFGLPPPFKIKNKEKYKIIDWITLSNRHGNPVTILEKDYPKPYLNEEEFFMNEVFLYDSKRSTAKNKKDVVVVSYLTENQKYFHEYSEAIVAKKIDEWINNSNIRGEKRYWRSEKQPDVSYYPIYIYHEKRNIISLERKIYDNEDSIEFFNDSKQIEINIVNNFCYMKWIF